jgi:DNA-binding transcriptional LysR family regulator
MNLSHASLSTLQLRALDSLLRGRNVTQTGDELGLTQSAISHTLGLLRRHFGDELLVRRGRAMDLTPFAESLRDPVRSVLRQIEDVSRLREDFDAASLTRTCVVAARDLTVSLFAPGLIARFTAQAPQASFRIIPWEAERLADQLAAGACDLAIGVDPPTNDGGLRIQKLYEDDYVAVCAQAKAPPGLLSLDDLVRRPGAVATRTDKSTSPVDLALAAQGLERRIVMRSAYFLSALSVVGETDLLMVVPRRLARKHAARFDLAILEVPLALPPFAVFSAGHERFANSALHRWLRRLAMEAVLDATAAIFVGANSRGRTAS